jgi:HNH endonuclease
MRRRSVSARTRDAVIRRAGNRCEYCLSPADYASDVFAVEHILPRSKGGLTQVSNLALSCQGCNNFKYTATEASDPGSGDLAPLYHPRKHLWQEHFAWNEDFTQILGVTPTGRATIARLKLNRPHVVNLRRLLHAASKHPPAEPVPQE